MTTPDEQQCPNCSSRKIVQRVVPDEQVPGSEVPVFDCTDCGEQWENYITFEARAANWADRHKRGKEA